MKKLHSSPITNVSLSEDGKLVATTGYDGKLNLWSSDPFELKWTFEAPELLNHSEFNSAGTQLTASCANGCVYILEISSGNCLSTLGMDGEHSDDVNCAHWLDLDHILTGCDTEDPLIRMWSVSQGKVIRVYKGHTDGVTEISFSSDRRRFVSSGEDSNLRIWDTLNGDILETISLPSDSETVSWCENKIVAGGNDGVLRVWNADSYILEKSKEYEGAVRSVTIDDKTGAGLIGVYGGFMHLINLETFETLYTFRHRLQWERGVSIGDKYIVSGSFGGTPMIYSRLNNELIISPEETYGANCVAYSVNGEGIIVGLDSGEVKIANHGIDLYKHSSITNTVIISPCGKYVFSGDYRGIGIIYEFNKNAPINENKISIGPINTAVWVGDNIYCGGYDCYIYKLSSDLKIISKWKAHSGPIKSICYSPMSDSLITAGSDGNIFRWKDANRETKYLSKEMYLVNSVSSQETSNKFVSASRDQRIRLWSTAEQNPLKILDVGHSKSIKAVAIHKDKDIFVSGGYDGRVILSELNGGEWHSRIIFEHGLPGVSAIIRCRDDQFISVGWDSSYTMFNCEGEILERRSLYTRTKR